MITISTAMKSLPIGIGMILLMSNTLFSTVTGNDIFINPWQLKAPNQPYDNYNATVGDTITFFWATTENHTVYINPTGNCNDTGSILVGSNSPASYTFLESDAKNSTDGKPVFFADNIAQLCEWGMRFVVNLIEQSDSGNTTNTTMAPIPSPTYDSTTATPSSAPTISLTLTPSQGPTDRTTTTKPSLTPSYGSTGSPSDAPIVITGVPSSKPSFTPSSSPTVKITVAPTNTPTNFPTTPPVPIPTAPPTSVPTPIPTGAPTPTPTPTAAPVVSRTPPPTTNPTEAPVLSTLVPTANPTFAPTAKPTAPPTDAAAVVTNTPTRAPIEQKTISPTYALTTQEPTEAPNESTQKISQTLKGLQMRMAGITDLPTAARVSWEELTESFSTSYVFNDMKGSVSNFVTTYEVTDISPIPLQRHQRMMRGNQRGLETQGIFVEYTQTVEYDTIDPNKFTPNLIVTSPFKTDDERTAYVTLLGTSPNDLLSQVSGVSEIQIQDVNPASPPESVSTDAPSTAPKKGIDLTKPAIIGIACGGAAILILCLIFCIYCCQSGGDSNGGSDGRSSGEPPLHVSVRDDEVSTLAGGPQTGTPMYGDQRYVSFGLVATDATYWIIIYSAEMNGIRHHIICLLTYNVALSFYLLFHFYICLLVALPLWITITQKHMEVPATRLYHQQEGPLDPIHKIFLFLLTLQQQGLRLVQWIWTTTTMLRTMRNITNPELIRRTKLYIFLLHRASWVL
jgi:hypothetical protein